MYVCPRRGFLVETLRCAHCAIPMDVGDPVVTIQELVYCSANCLRGAIITEAAQRPESPTPTEEP